MPSIALRVLLLFVPFGLNATGLRASPAPADTLSPAARALQRGIRSYQRGQFDSAITVLNQSARLARATRPHPDTINLLRAYNNLGNVAGDQGNNPRALGFYQQALALAEAARERRFAAKVGNNIGTLFQNWGRSEEALRYYEQAEREAHALADPALLADCNNNKGVVYEQWKQYGRARTYYQQALRFYEQARQPHNVAMALSNLAIVQKRQNDFPASIASTRRALAIARQTSDAWLEAATLNNLGNTYLESGQPAVAEPFLQQALTIARRLPAQELVAAAYGTLAQGAAQAGRYRAAYDYQKAFIAQKDSFVNAERHRQLSELQVKYDTQKKERENEQLRYENRLRALAQQKAEQDRQRTLNLAGGSGLALLLLGGVGGHYRRLRRHHREALARNQALFDGEQQERVRLARDLHDGVGQHLAVVRMYVSELQEGGPDAPAHAAQALTLVDQTIKEVRSVSHNLIPDELNFGLLRALRELSHRVNQTGTVQLHLHLGPELQQASFPRTFELALYRVVQEVVNGMLRHADASEISLRLYRSGPQLLVEMADNGKGFDTRLLTQSKGLGWKNIQARVGLLNGQLRVQSRPGQGTQVRIAVPE
ncbi:hypothetical protein GCM10023185_22690 [Hymenobacter saemangeumensis]|uniref:histidine kinase n=1 Tax=Hymenobacter saemangeumensis TaxID=1084522 RepID=A0ABP8IFT2_9BACT